MDLDKCKEKVKKIFQEYNVLNETENYDYNTTVRNCQNGTEILIYFPGSKRNNICGIVQKYDYRVDLKKKDEQYTLSHEDIIVDLYFKCLKGFSSHILKDLLIDLFEDGIISEKYYPEIKSYEIGIPSPLLAEGADSPLKQFYERYSLFINRGEMSFEELLYSIKWIAIQEDLNYPIPNCKGRKLALCRYIEAIWSYEFNKHSLDEVIVRAKSSGVKPPSKWDCYCYSFLKLIN